jgi:hypothetical protein
MSSSVTETPGRVACPPSTTTVKDAFSVFLSDERLLLINQDSSQCLRRMPV